MKHRCLMHIIGDKKIRTSFLFAGKYCYMVVDWNSAWTLCTGCKIEELCVALPASMKDWLFTINLPEFVLSHIRYAYL